MEIKNCKECHKLMVSDNLDVCIDCYKEEMNLLTEVISYLKGKPLSTFEETVDNTNVTEKKLKKLLLQNRPILTDRYPNMGIPCKMCGKNSRRGEICLDCRKNLEAELKKVELHQRLKLGNEKGIYHSKDKRN